MTSATRLTIARVEREAAPVGPPNPLPPLRDGGALRYEPDEAIPPRIAANMRYGRVASIHPYLRQDGYGRDRAPRETVVAVLEDERLRAEFALDLGGRLLSLVDRRADRELLWRNPVIQPANLALRNAWFAGGAEWNIGLRGHSPLTCSPVFAGRVTSEHGDVLRLWEFERLRGLLFQLDFALDPERPRLVWRTRVRNLGAATVPMYWWTNIAVPEAGARVFAPARSAYRNGADERLEVVDLRGGDFIRAERAAWAADTFFDTGDADPWIAAVDARGDGVAHASTAPLRGRKLFVWGTTSGGRRWNDWLSGGRGGAYAEIQAGLTTTQYEHIPMPGRTEWSWRESLGPIAAGADVANAPWDDAVAAMAGRVAEALPIADDPVGDAIEALADEPPEVLHRASDWLALERELARRDGDEWPATPGTPVAPDPSTETGPWWAMLRGEPLAARPLDEPPASYVAGDRWRAVLERAVPDWWTRYQRAVLAHAAGDLAAEELYRASLASAETAWALRGLAHLVAASASRDELVDLVRRAIALRPADVGLRLDLVVLLRDQGATAEAWVLLTAIPAGSRRGRGELLEAELALRTGRPGRARELLRGGIVVPDIREGETSLSQLWREAIPDEPVPAAYDFEMS
jgi:hypothetical protein